MKRKIVNLVLMAAVCASMSVPVYAEEAGAAMEEYGTVTEVDDFFTSITKVIVKFDKEVSGDITPDQFHASVRRTYAGTDELVQEMSYETFQFKTSPTAEGERTVKNVYVSDENGNPVEGASNYVTLEMECSPTEGYGSALGAETETGLNFNVLLDCNYTIEYTDADGNTQTCTTKNDDLCQIPYADKFTHNQKYETQTPEILNDGLDNDTLYYASYEPEDDEKHPLVIWLHGAGEGGATPDTRIPLIGNKAGVFGDEEFQDIIGGAYVLAPQTPTVWMNATGTTYDLSAENPTSMYTQTLMELIESYVDAHENIDKDRIIIGGCSNGGYMTMNMLINYPDYFAAGFPICEAYSDEYITDEQIESIKDIPIWFTHSAADPLVVPDQTTVPTYNRLLAAGAENDHFTYWTDVHDTTGRFTDENGNPYVVYGHASWAYMFDNLCTADNDYQEGVTTDSAGTGETIFQWIAEQTK